MPPAVEMARAIGAVPVKRTGTALMRAASAAGVMVETRSGAASVASCSKPIAAGERLAALRRNVDSDCFPRDAESRCSSAVRVTSGRRSMCRIASPEAAMASRSGADKA